MRAYSYLFCFFFSLLLTGCATQASVLGIGVPLSMPGHGFIATNLVYQYDNSSDGWGASVPSMQVEYYSVGNLRDPAFVLTSRGVMYPVPKERLGGELHAMLLVPVKPGRYQMGRVRAYFSVNERYLDLDSVDIPVLEIRENEVTYAGSILLPTRFGKNIFGQAIPVSSSLTVTDQFARDIAAMKEADSGLNALKIKNGLAK